MATAAVLEARGAGPLQILLGKFILHGLLLFRRAHRAADFTPKGRRTAHCLVPEQTNDLSLRDGLFGFILQMAVNAAHFNADVGLAVQTVLVSGIDAVHGVAERAAELRGTGPVNNSRTGGNKGNAHNDTDQDEAAGEPFAVFVKAHFSTPEPSAVQDRRGLFLFFQCVRHAVSEGRDAKFHAALVPRTAPEFVCGAPGHPRGKY